MKKILGVLKKGIIICGLSNIALGAGVTSAPISLPSFNVYDLQIQPINQDYFLMRGSLALNELLKVGTLNGNGNSLDLFDFLKLAQLSDSFGNLDSVYQNALFFNDICFLSASVGNCTGILFGKEHSNVRTTVIGSKSTGILPKAIPKINIPNPSLIIDAYNASITKKITLTRIVTASQLGLPLGQVGPVSLNYLPLHDLSSTYFHDWGLRRSVAISRSKFTSNISQTSWRKTRIDWNIISNANSLPSSFYNFIVTISKRNIYSNELPIVVNVNYQDGFWEDANPGEEFQYDVSLKAKLKSEYFDDQNLQLTSQLHESILSLGDNRLVNDKITIISDSLRPLISNVDSVLSWVKNSFQNFISYSEIYLGGVSGLKVVKLCGDTDFDGYLSPKDSQIAFDYFLNKPNLGPVCKTCADVNGDGFIGPDDAQRIFEAFLQLPGSTLSCAKK